MLRVSPIKCLLVLNMPPLGKQTRANRTVKTPKRYKNGACVNEILETPTRGAMRVMGSARVDRETPVPPTISETTN